MNIKQWSIWQIFKSKIPPRSIEAAYWEHPNGTILNSNQTTKHPHKLTVWQCEKVSGKRLFGSPHTIFPFVDNMWVIDYSCSRTRGQVLDLHKINLINNIKQWCLENCQGNWCWSIDESEYFIEMGGRHSVGQHKARTFYLSIENDEDAVHFRLVFDMQCSCFGYKTKQQIIDKVNDDNKQEGWKKYKIEFCD